MTDRIDLFYNTYANFSEQVLDIIRKETFGVDIGQNSWLTVDEYDRWLPWLKLTPDHHILEVASGSGGPALHIARAIGCKITGIDENENGVATATQMAAKLGLSQQATFRVANANSPLPFDDVTFDALICIDSMNHFPDRLAVFKEWRRVLRKGGRAIFTDPVVITGPVTNDDLAIRSSIGLFLFVPPGANEQFIKQAGLQLIRQVDVTENAALVSGRWHQARQAHKAELLQMEGAERFEGLQKFFKSVHDLTRERRLSRVVYLVEK